MWQAEVKKNLPIYGGDLLVCDSVALLHQSLSEERRDLLPINSTCISNQYNIPQPHKSNSNLYHLKALDYCITCMIQNSYRSKSPMLLASDIFALSIILRIVSG